MTGQTKYCNLSGPYMIKDIPVFNIDYRALTEYARSLKKKVYELSDEEKNKFIKNASMQDIRKKSIK